MNQFLKNFQYDLSIYFLIMFLFIMGIVILLHHLYPINNNDTHQNYPLIALSGIALIFLISSVIYFVTPPKLSINEIKNVYDIEDNKSEIKFTLKDNQDKIYIPSMNYNIKKLNHDNLYELIDTSNQNTYTLTHDQLKTISNNLELD